MKTQLNTGQKIVLSVAGLVVVAAVSLLVANAITHTLRSAGNGVPRTASQVVFIDATYDVDSLASGDVFLLDVDSGAVTRLTSGEQVKLAEWSPDGQDLYLADRTRGTGYNYKLNVGSGELTPLADRFAIVTSEYVMSVSPDRKQILYGLPQLFDAMQGKVTVAGPDGASPRTLGDGAEPRWSPDGKRIVFVNGSGDTSTDIYTMAADGSDVRKVAGLPDADLRPSWTPDGQTIVFGNFKLGQYGTAQNGTLYRVGADGKNLVQLGPVDEVYMVKVLPNGKGVYATGPGNTCITPIEGGQAVCKHPAESTLAPDGKRVLMVNDNLSSPFVAATNVQLCVGMIDGVAFTDGPCLYTAKAEVGSVAWRPAQ